MSETCPVLATWKIIEHDYHGRVVSEKELKNMVVNTGRELLLKCLFMTAGSAGVIAMGVGASSTAAAVTQTSLVYELTGNGIRKPLTNVNGNPLSAADILSETVVISSNTYQRKLTAQSVWDTGDGNNNNIFAEYGLFTVLPTPGTPTASSGIMYNRLVDPSPTLKTGANSITAQVTVRF